MHELRICSQNGEDGIIMYIFSKIGCTNRKFVEIGIQDGRECNTANLAINFGWPGHMFEGDLNHVRSAEKYYDSRLTTKKGQVQIIHAFATMENINQTLRQTGLKGEIDLLSIDIDGNDYWIWQAIDVIDPRVVVIEYNAYLPLDRPIAVKYDPYFNRYNKHKSGFYYGASLTAFHKLAISKGYILLGCDSCGVNAFFAKKAAAGGDFQDLADSEAYYGLSSGSKNRPAAAEAFSQIAQMEFEIV